MREMIQFYTSGAWGSRVDLIRPIQGNEAYDETLDKIQVSSVSIGSDDLYPYGTKCRVLFANETATYDANNKPLNHREFIVESGDLIKSNYFTKHNYKLIEPTHYLKQVRMESLTFTSRDSITVKEFVGGVWTDVTYTKTPYNLYSMIVRIFKTTRYKTSVEDNSLYSKIRIMDVSLLSSIGINVDDQFKENTVYDALFKLGKYFGNQGRVPVLYFSQDSGYEYDLYFERTDGLDLPQLTYSTFIANARSIVKSISPSQVADAVVSDATNMVSYNKAQGIAQDWYGFAIYDGENQTIASGSTAKPFLKLPHKIGDVVQVRSILSQYNGAFTIFENIFTTIPCVKRSEWEIRSDRDDITYYDENEKKIYFGDDLASDVLLYNSSSSSTATRLYFNVQYYPNIDAKITKTKDDEVIYETTFNQVDSYIDAGTYGNMLENYVKTNGNNEITVGTTSASLSSMAKLGQQVINGSDTYNITSINYRSFNDVFEVNYQLTLNAVKRNDYVGASQKIREGGINYKNTEVRYSTIRDSVYIKFMTTAPTSSSNKYLLDKKTLLFGLFTSAQKEVNRNELVQQAYLRNRSTVYKVGTGYVTQNEYVQYGFASTRVGNSILLNIQFDDIKIAGYKLTPNSPIEQTPVYYSNPFAEVDKLTIGFGTYKAISTNIATQPDGVNFDLTVSERANIDLYAKTYPDLSEADFNTYYASSSIQINTYEWLKDAREIGNISYQLDWFGEDCSINNELLDYCGLLQRDNTTPTLYVIVLTAGKKLAENDIILSADIDQFQSAGNPITTNRANYIKYTASAGIGATNQTVALCKLVTTGVYKPLVFANGRTFASTTSFYIGY